jgi:AraC-like DNA-binding protein
MSDSHASFPAAATEPPGISVGYVRGFIDYLQRQGMALADLLTILGIEEKDLSDVDLRVPYTALINGFAWAEHALNDPNIGLRAGLNMRVTNLGIVGLIAQTCSNGAQLFELHERHGRLIGSGIWSQYATAGDEISVTLRSPASLHLSHRQIIDFHLSGWLAIARYLLGTDFTLLRIEFAHARPARLDEHLAWFECPLYFDCPTPRAWIPAAYATRSMLGGDALLHQSLELEAHKRFQTLQLAGVKRDPCLAALHAFLAGSLESGVPEIGAAAQALGVSPRRLQRDLEARQTSYTNVVDTVRQEQAARLLRDPQRSLVEIALVLGFVDQSGFHRAFRRWFGMTPGDYRAAQRQAGGPMPGRSR